MTRVLRRQSPAQGAVGAGAHASAEKRAALTGSSTGRRSRIGTYGISRRAAEPPSLHFDARPLDYLSPLRGIVTDNLPKDSG
jgi:hypothetical protein